jgi:hypothetical protein
MVGPSPFHADFFLTLEQGGRSKDLFITKHKPQPGYDTLEIACCTSLGVEDARDALFESVLDEFALFYDLKRRMSAQMDSWFRTQESIREALKPTSARRGWQKLGWLFTRRTIFRRIIHSLLTFRADATYFKAQIREDYRSHYESGKYQPFIKSFVDGEIADIYEYPVSEALETMKFEFDRVTKYLEWSTVFLAAIFGGIVGAAVTRMVTPPDVPTVSAAPPIAVPIPKPTSTAHAVSPLHPK